MLLYEQNVTPPRINIYVQEQNEMACFVLSKV